MSPLLGYRVQAVVAFAASLYVGLRAARKDDGARSVRRSVAMNVLSSLGLVLGYGLARRSLDRDE